MRNSSTGWIERDQGDVMRAWLITAFLVFLMASLLMPRLSWSGGISSGGSDLADPLHGSAWFLDARRTIRYCIEISPAFPVPEAEVASEIHFALSTWARYLDLRLPRTGAPDTLRMSIARQATLTPRCADADLRFLIGVEDSEVTHYKEGFNDPVAFATRIAYEPLTGWGKGFIWVNGASRLEHEGLDLDWKRPGALRGILLHELGHVFGCDHVPGTIMQPDLADLLMRNYGADRKGAIDGTRQLSPCRSDECISAFESVLGGRDWTSDPEHLAAVFAALTGAKPRGTAKVSVHGRLASARFERIVLKDEAGAREFRISSVGGITAGTPVLYPFRTALQEQDLILPYTQEHSSWVLTGIATAADGHRFTFLVAYNLDLFAPLVLKAILPDGETVVLGQFQEL
jgi:hypothetical protein